MNELKHIRTNVKTSIGAWCKFKKACKKQKSSSGDVLGFFINLVNENQIDIPVIPRKKHLTSANNENQSFFKNKDISESDQSDDCAEN